MQCVILAGGLATRIRPHTLTIPKSLIEIAGHPFIDWQLSCVRKAGYRNVVLCVAHLGELIKAHVGAGERFDMRVLYSDDGPTMLGTAGALRRALPLLEDELLVTYGDSYLPFDYASPLKTLVENHDCDGVMSVFKNNGRWDSSNVRTDGTRILSYAKGTQDPAFDHIDYGALALRRSVVAALQEGVPSDLAALQRDLAQQGRLRAVVAHERFYEIGSFEGIATLDQYLSIRTSAVEISGRSHQQP
jgi:NDP-sugar pyrophosphorylase family protein